MPFRDDDDWRADIDEPDDDGWDDEDDDDSGDEASTIACPACGQPMFDDAPSCPECGHYLTADEAYGRDKPKWFLIAFWLCLLGASTWLAFLWR